MYLYQKRLPFLVTLWFKWCRCWSRFFIDAYVAALYLPEVSTDADGILASGSPLDIRVVIISDLVTADRFAESAMDGFVRSTHGDHGADTSSG